MITVPIIMDWDEKDYKKLEKVLREIDKSEWDFCAEDVIYDIQNIDDDERDIYVWFQHIAELMAQEIIDLCIISLESTDNFSVIEYLHGVSAFECADYTNDVKFVGLLASIKKPLKFYDDVEGNVAKVIDGIKEKLV